MGRITLNKEDKDNYINSPAHCPVCNSDGIESGAGDFVGALCTCDCKCNSCGSTWTDIYRLTNVVNVTVPENYNQTDEAYKFPKYVKMGHSAIRFREIKDGVANYYRDAGNWDVNVLEKDGKLITQDGFHAHMNNIEVEIITREEWLEDNKGYC